MIKKEGDFSDVSYVLGITSIVLAFFQPIAAFILGIIGFVHSKKQKTPLSEKAKKLSVIGIVISIIFFAVTAALTYFAISSGISNLPIK